MPKMSEEKLNEYRALDRDYWEGGHIEAKEAVKRWKECGVRIGTYGHRIQNGFFQTPYKEDPEGADIAFIGIPLDINAMGQGGTRHGPEAVRRRSLFNFGPVHEQTGKVPFEQCNIIDNGDVEFGETNLKLRLEEIAEKFYTAASAGAYTLGIGGEHTCTFGILEALSKAHNGEAFGMVHIDAHGDTMGSKSGDIVNDGSCMRQAVLHGYLDPERTVQIGIRNSLSKVIWDFSYDSGMTVITADEVHEKGTQYVLDKVREIVGVDKSYFTLDVDGICSTYMMGTTNPEPFGLTNLQTRDIIRGCRGLNIVGADLMELNPLVDQTGSSTLLATHLVYELMCLLADSRVQQTGKTNPTIWN